MTFDFRILAIILAFTAVVFSPTAEAQVRMGNGELNVPATMVAESQRVKPGQNVTLAFVMEPKPTWHGYWENPGDAGIGMSFDWTLPAGVSAGKAQFQVPDRLLISGIMNYVYKGDYAVLVNLTLSDRVQPGPLPISVKSEWLSCTDEICVPEQDEMSITLQVVGKDADIVLDKRFNGFRAALPRPLGSEASFAVTDDLFRLSIPLPAGVALDTPYFFIHNDGIVDYAAPQKFSRDGDRLILETQARGEGLDMISGVLKIGDHMGLSFTATRGEVAMTGVPLRAEDGPKDQNLASLLFLALGGAIVGGLLLNLMPCVFPILSLKAISLAKAGGNEAVVRRDALAYTAGVVLVATSLGAILLGLRASGAAVGWAFQLQDPRIIFVLLALVTAIGFNLAGMFELPQCQFRQQAGPERRGSRIVLDRRARRLCRHALHRPIHGSRTRRHHHPATGRGIGHLCRPGRRPCLAVPADRIRAGDPQSTAQTRTLAGRFPQSDGGPDVPHQHRPDLVARPSDRHRCAGTVADIPAAGCPDPVVVWRRADEGFVPRSADQRGNGRRNIGRHHRPARRSGDGQPEAGRQFCSYPAERTV